MIKSGKEHLEQISDGRTVYVGDEKIKNVTTHPVFSRAAKTVADIYDLKHQSQYKDDKEHIENL